MDNFSQDLLKPEDLHCFNEGRHFRLYEKLGAHLLRDDKGVHFSIWAPNAKHVSVIGDFNGWNKKCNALHPVASSGLWSGVVQNAAIGQRYKFYIESHIHNYKIDKSDPFSFLNDNLPSTASIITDLSYHWNDNKWMEERGRLQAFNQPMCIYELHLGSWRRGDNNRILSYEEIAEKLVQYITLHGFTHVEFMPVMEHPFLGSWGYQITGYFAPAHIHGKPQQLMKLIDVLHQSGIGVILDWVPSHFPLDQNGLSFFDGTHLYEHADSRQGYHPDWKSCIFNYGRSEVKNFLISNAIFWLEKYHADALRVDAVASMLYLDYSRKEGDWIPNKYGGRENLEAAQFLKELAEEAYKRFPDIYMIAEESTSWPMVSRPVYEGGLGFSFKWDMGWMNDTLNYFKTDPFYRRQHQNDITFRSIYAFHENFILPLSHDEVAHGKGSLIGRMPGDDWQKFANLRCLYTYMYTQPGKKLLFMGGEFAQWAEWNHNHSLDWHLLQYDSHAQMLNLITDLNFLYRKERSLHLDCDPQGFMWVDAGDAQQSVIIYIRKNPSTNNIILCSFNFGTLTRTNYRIGVPYKGAWNEIFNSDHEIYGGSGIKNNEIESEDIPYHNQPYSLQLSLPPLAGIMMKWSEEDYLCDS